MATSIIESLVDNLIVNVPATELAISELERSVGVQLPEAYRSLMRRSNGIEGFVDNSQFMALWPVEEVVKLNKAYNVSELAPGLLFFGSDGGGQGFAFDCRRDSMPVVEVSFIGMSLDETKQRGCNFDEFLKDLIGQNRLS